MTYIEALAVWPSGTTGSAKGVVLGHDNQTFQAACKVAAVGLDRRTVYLAALPLFHVGSISIALGVVSAGGSLVLEPALAWPDAWTLIDRHAVSLLTSAKEEERFAQYKSELGLRVEVINLRFLS